MRLRAILFDLDDTLVDRTGAFARLVDELLARHPAAFPDPAAARAELLRADAGGYAERGDFCAWAAARFPGLGLTGEGFWEAHASRVAEHVAPRPEVSALLARLAERYALGVVSDGGGPRQRAKLERAELAPYVSAVAISGEAGVSKPDPRLFLQALAALGVEADDALHVGDHPARDVAGARAAGLRTCWVARGRRFPPGLAAPDLSVEEVTGLEAALEARLTRRR